LSEINDDDDDDEDWLVVFVEYFVLKWSLRPRVRAFFLVYS